MFVEAPTRKPSDEISVVLSAAKDLIAACNERALTLLAMRSFAALRMTG
jgi:hypothetical protein